MMLTHICCVYSKERRGVLGIEFKVVVESVEAWPIIKEELETYEYTVGCSGSCRSSKIPIVCAPRLEAAQLLLETPIRSIALEAP